MEPADATTVSAAWVWVAKYLSDELSADENIAFTQWLSNNPARADAVERVRASWHGQKSAPPGVDTEAALTALFERATVPWPTAKVLATRDRVGRMSKRPWTYTTLRRHWFAGGFAVVAALMLVLIVGRAWRFGASRHDSVTHTYATNDNQQGILPLGDGSRVLMSPGTTLRTVDAGDRSRTVILDRGEAYFEVAPLANAPFVVKSGSVTAQVLGTAFLIRRYAGEHRVRVSVTDGKVHVASHTRSAAGVVLTAGHVGEITDSATHIETIDDFPPRVEWQHGQLVFHDTPVATVLQALERWYGYQFICTDSALPSRNVTIVLSTGSSASALAKLEQILAVNLTVVGDTITLTPHVHASKQIPQGRQYDVWTFSREVGR